MKKHLFMQALCCLTLLSTAACNDDDHDGHTPPEAARQALTTRYPDAVRISWKQRDSYEVADFERPDKQLPDGWSDCEAWFDASGRWYMTESEIARAALPQAVRTAFESSDYAAWRIDEIERIERDGLETLYRIECEGRPSGSGEVEIDLYYSADGVLVRSVVDGDPMNDPETWLPTALPGTVTAYIATRYPDARIVEIDLDRTTGLLEVEILDGRIRRDLYFAAGEWVRTESPIAVAELPQAVRTTIAASEYATWKIDEADFVEEPARSYYLVELESGNREVELRIDAAGNLLA